MFIIFMGIVVIVIGFVIANNESPVKPYSGMIRIIGFLIVIAGAGLASVKQIEPVMSEFKNSLGKLTKTFLKVD